MAMWQVAALDWWVGGMHKKFKHAGIVLHHPVHMDMDFECW